MWGPLAVAARSCNELSPITATDCVDYLTVISSCRHCMRLHTPAFNSIKLERFLLFSTPFTGK